MYGMTPVGVFFTAIFPLVINDQALCQQPHDGQKRVQKAPTQRIAVQARETKHSVK